MPESLRPGAAGHAGVRHGPARICWWPWAAALWGIWAGSARPAYMRGIDFVNCPTTTLSQVDSSIGGKTAIDLGETKNIVGAFWQPKVVLVDFDTLATLPRRQFVNGLAEAHEDRS